MSWSLELAKGFDIYQWRIEHFEQLRTNAVEWSLLPLILWLLMNFLPFFRPRNLWIIRLDENSLFIFYHGFLNLHIWAWHFKLFNKVQAKLTGWNTVQDRNLCSYSKRFCSDRWLYPNLWDQFVASIGHTLSSWWRNCYKIQGLLLMTTRKVSAASVISLDTMVAVIRLIRKERDER